MLFAGFKGSRVAAVLAAAGAERPGQDEAGKAEIEHGAQGVRGDGAGPGRTAHQIVVTEAHKRAARARDDAARRYVAFLKRPDKSNRGQY